MKETELFSLIDQYYVDKAKSDELKKQVEEENGVIKQAMLDAGTDVVETENYKAVRSVRTNDSIDEEAWLRILKAQAQLPEGIIKTKEYIDTDALEDAIYNGKIPKSVLLELNKFRTTKEIIALKVTKRKKGKQDA